MGSRVAARPKELRDKEAYVRSIFDAIAKGYDLMNLLMTGGVWRYWQACFRRFNGITPGQSVLDVGCGTADLSLLVARQVGPSGRVTGIDISEEMLAVGRRKVGESPFREMISLIYGNALDIPFPKDTFDVVVTGFVMRNVRDLDKALTEMFRVLRPGGWAVVMELSHPRSALVRKPFLFYFQHVVPLLGVWAAKRASVALPPYSWLPESLRSFPDAATLARRMEGVGFERVNWRPLTGGIACLHKGFKPSSANSQLDHQNGKIQ